MARKRTTKRTTSPATEGTCLCGCGTKTARTFAQGHDAKLAGRGRRGEGPFSKEQRSWLWGHGIRLRKS